MICTLVLVIQLQVKSGRNYLLPSVSHIHCFKFVQANCKHSFIHFVTAGECCSCRLVALWLVCVNTYHGLQCDPDYRHSFSHTGQSVQMLEMHLWGVHAVSHWNRELGYMLGSQFLPSSSIWLGLSCSSTCVSMPLGYSTTRCLLLYSGHLSSSLTQTPLVKMNECTCVQYMKNGNACSICLPAKSWKCQCIYTCSMKYCTFPQVEYLIGFPKM